MHFDIAIREKDSPEKSDLEVAREALDMCLEFTDWKGILEHPLMRYTAALRKGWRREEVRDEEARRQEQVAAARAKAEEEAAAEQERRVQAALAQAEQDAQAQRERLLAEAEKRAAEEAEQLRAAEADEDAADEDAADADDDTEAEAERIAAEAEATRQRLIEEAEAAAEAEHERLVAVARADAEAAAPATEPARPARKRRGGHPSPGQPTEREFEVNASKSVPWSKVTWGDVDQCIAYQDERIRYFNGQTAHARMLKKQLVDLRATHADADPQALLIDTGADLAEAVIVG